MSCGVNFDGIPGPTHNYAGLAQGNLAAARNASLVANPREAALQGIAKMRALARRGFAQAVLPPHERPYLPALRALGFAGTDAEVLERAARAAPRLVAACSSAAAMWAANAATVSASADTEDKRVHFTPANLVSHFHRSIETATTSRVLGALFADASRFVVHAPLPAAAQFGDEGAANHTRFVDSQGCGVSLFVYGHHAFDSSHPAPSRYPARQSFEASSAHVRRHGLDPGRVVVAQQDPAAIDSGVFHNDVIAVGTAQVLFCHARAFVELDEVVGELRSRIGDAFEAIVVGEHDVSIDDAVSTYLFNSQLLQRTDGRLLLVAPQDCLDHPGVAPYVEKLLASGGPIAEVLPFDLRQSMRNGGGPACLRLIVPLTAAERAAVSANVFVDDALADSLEGWVSRHYRDRLAPADLADPSLLDESRRALDELCTLLRLPPVYDFQLAG